MKNYFQIFDIPQSFAIDANLLEQKYITLQKQFHPDKLVLKPEGERLVLATLSVDINDGYHILKDALSRSEYLLELNGIIVNQDAKDTIKPNQMILMQALEQRETLDEISDVEGLKKLESDIKASIKSSENKLAEYYVKEPKELESAAYETINLKYLTKFLEDIKLRLKKFK